MLARAGEHEDLVEADFQRIYHLDYRDVYRPGGGSSRLTLRRFSNLLANLPPESLFMSEVELRPPMSETSLAVMDIWEALQGKQHPRKTAVQDRLEQERRNRLILEKREQARRFNKKRK